jgi:hypothetical protein
MPLTSTPLCQRLSYVFCREVAKLKFLLVNRKSLYEAEMVVGLGNDKKNDLFEQILELNGIGM